jgi:hypothetical protein
MTIPDKRIFPRSRCNEFRFSDFWLKKTRSKPPFSQPEKTNQKNYTIARRKDPKHGKQSII